MSDHITIQAAAEILGVSDDTVRRRIAEGLLRGFRLAGSRLIRVSETEVRALLRPIPNAKS